MVVEGTFITSGEDVEEVRNSVTDEFENSIEPLLSNGFGKCKLCIKEINKCNYENTINKNVYDVRFVLEISDKNFGYDTEYFDMLEKAMGTSLNIVGTYN